MPRKQVHTYLSEEVYRELATLAQELGIAQSAFLVMLVRKAWDERNGGDRVKVSYKSNSKPVEISETEQVPMLAGEDIGGLFDRAEELAKKYPDRVTIHTPGRKHRGHRARKG